MRNFARCAALIAVVPILALSAACSTRPSTKVGSGSSSTASAPTTANQKQTQPAKATRASAGPNPGVTQDELAAYQKVTACLRQHGVAAPDPKVGVPYDSSAVDSLFGTDTKKFNDVLAACPDFERVVVGVK